MAESKFLKHGVAGIFLLSIFVLSFLILNPIIIAIVFGLLFGYIFRPIYKAIEQIVRGKNLSAFILIIGIAALFIWPLLYFAPTIVKQLANTYAMFQNFNFIPLFEKFVEPDIAINMVRNLDNVIGKMFSGILNQFTAFVSQKLAGFLLQVAVFLFTFYFVVKDMDKLKAYLSSLSPFSKSTEKKFLEEFRGITKAIVIGQILIGLAQGLAIGVCLYFLNVPNTLMLTLIACVVSMVPVLGSWVVWLPVGITLLVTGQTFSGIFLLLYGALFVSIIDNFLRPYFLSKTSNLPIPLSVIGTIGGLFFFGIAGLVLGPLILAYALIILEMYKQGKLNELLSH